MIAGEILLAPSRRGARALLGRVALLLLVSVLTAGVAHAGAPVLRTLTITGEGEGAVRVDGVLQSLPWTGQFSNGTRVTLEAVPADGWEFDSWSGDATGTDNPTTVTIGTNRSVHVTFTRAQYTLSLDKVGNGTVKVNGTPHSLPWSGQFASGSVVTLEADPAAGWRFASWSGDASGSANPVTITMDGARSAVAAFSRIERTLSLTGAGAGAVLVDGALQALPWSGSFYHGDSVTLEAVPDAGWRFDGWSGDANWSGATLTVTMDANKSITATFTQAQYTLSLAKVGNGAARVNGTTIALPWSGQFEAGVQVDLQALPSSGWQFQAWSGDANWSGATLTVTMTADKSITAEFAERTTFLLKIKQSGSGSVKVNGSPVSVPYQADWPRGDAVTIEAVPAAEWTFKWWGDDLAGATANPATVAMDRDWEVEAQFAQVLYTVSIAGSGSGSVKVNGTARALPWSGQFASGSTISLEALPEAGWDFAGWSGGVSGSANPVSVTVTGNLTIQAAFSQPETFMLRVRRIGAGSVKIDGVRQDLPWSGVIPNGAAVVIEAVTDGEGEFIEWSGDASGADNPITVVMDGNKRVTARFTCSGMAFSDVDCGNWAADAIAALNSAGITQGYPDGLYRPNLAVDRASMAVFLARALCGGDEGIPEPPEDPMFSDVPASHWAYAAIEYVAACGIAEGYGNGTYQPAWNVTRAHMAGFIARAIVSPMGDEGLAGYAPPAVPSFRDVPTSHWAYQYVEYLVSAGIVGGYDDGFYRPAGNVTRDQMAVFVARAFGLID